MEKIHATQEWVEEYLKSAIDNGEPVYVLEKGKDFTTNSTGTIIIDTMDGNLLDLSDYTVVVPEGIVEIQGSDTFTPYIEANKVILPTTCKKVSQEAFKAKEQTILSEGIVNIEFIEMSIYGNLYLPASLTHITLTTLPKNVYVHEETESISIEYYSSGSSGDIYFPRKTHSISLNSHGNDANIYVNNPQAVIIDMAYAYDYMNIYGYAGSTAEKFAKEYNCKFINIGSDYSIPIHNSKVVETDIQPNEFYSFTEIDNLTVIIFSQFSNNQLDEYMFSFVTPEVADNSFLQIISDKEIQWVKEPNIKPDYIYEVSIVNNVGVIAGVPNKEVSE